MDITLSDVFAKIMARAPEDKFDPKIKRVKEVLALLTNPQDKYRTIHITGTNGKTSTSRMIESLMREHGLKTGLFTSPHLISVTERVQINGKPVFEGDFVNAYLELEECVKEYEDALPSGAAHLSFFEMLVCLAYMLFVNAKVDVAVIEVGMGGSFDATNVIVPSVSVITPIALDHTNYLGETISEIANEKAGIIKTNVPVICAEQHEEVEEIIKDRARETASKLLIEPYDISVISDRQELFFKTKLGEYNNVKLSLLGEHQAHNALLALAAAEQFFGEAIEETLVSKAFSGVTSPGRLETVLDNPTVIIDAAHNPHAANSLAEATRNDFNFEYTVGVLAVLKDKDVGGILEALKNSFDTVIVTENKSPRAMKKKDLAKMAVKYFAPEQVIIAESVPSAIDKAKDILKEHFDVESGIIITGSIITIGEAKAIFT
jgi:dihydrofolate synthase/folylpolyglutamate synthase